MAGAPVDKGRMVWIGKAAVSLTFVDTSDLAACLAAAVAGRFMPGHSTGDGPGFRLIVLCGQRGVGGPGTPCASGTWRQGSRHSCG